jgi:segregation and condensation protein B
MSLRGAVEAALFAAGGPIQIKDLAQLVGSPADEVEEMLGKLRTEYRDREGGLEVVRHAGGLWVLQVPKQYTTLVHRLVPPDLETPLMKTLSVVALLQPCLQSKVIERRGQSAYQHLRELEKRGFITREPESNSFLVKTTPEFARRFRLKDDPEAIRTALKERADVTPDQPDIEPANEPLSADALQVLAEEGAAVAAETPATAAELEAELVKELEPLAQEAAPQPAPEAPPVAEAPPPEPTPEPELEAPPSNITRLADHDSLRTRVLHGSERTIYRIPRARKAR